MHKVRQQQYLQQLKGMEQAAGGCGCVAVLRMQCRPLDLMSPPRFGDLIIVWNPKARGPSAGGIIACDASAATRSPSHSACRALLRGPPCRRRRGRG